MLGNKAIGEQALFAVLFVYFVLALLNDFVLVRSPIRRQVYLVRSVWRALASHMLLNKAFREQALLAHFVHALLFYFVLVLLAYPPAQFYKTKGLKAPRPPKPYKSNGLEATRPRKPCKSNGLEAPRPQKPYKTKGLEESEEEEYEEEDEDEDEYEDGDEEEEDEEEDKDQKTLMPPFRTKHADS